MGLAVIVNTTVASWINAGINVKARPPTVGICGDFEIWVSKTYNMPYLPVTILWLHPPCPTSQKGICGHFKHRHLGSPNPCTKASIPWGINYAVHLTMQVTSPTLPVVGLVVMELYSDSCISSTQPPWKIFISAPRSFADAVAD